MMTFEEFQATGTEHEDLALIPAGARNWFAGPGREYVHELFIEQGKPQADGCRIYYLTLGNYQATDYGLDGLARLERKLYEWAIAEGYLS